MLFYSTCGNGNQWENFSNFLKTENDFSDEKHFLKSLFNKQFFDTIWYNMIQYDGLILNSF